MADLPDKFKARDWRWGVSIAAFIVVLTLGSVSKPDRVLAQGPSQVTDEDLEKLRHRLDELALKRVSGPEEELPWEQDASSEFGESRSMQSVVQISSESYKLACVWVFRSLSNPKESAVRACIFRQGKDYLVLAPGDYEVTLHSGRAVDLVIGMKPRRVQLRKGNVYRSEFSLDIEDAVMRRIKQITDEAQQKDEDTDEAF